MRIRASAVTLSALLAAGLMISHQPVPVACSSPVHPAQRALALHAAVARFTEAARAAIAVPSASTKGSAAGVRDEHAPAPNFAVPGPGWG